MNLLQAQVSVSEVKVSIFTMALSEVDSFIHKFKILLHSGKNSNLTIRSEAGKAFVTLTVEVDDLPGGHPHHHLHSRSRNGPARQRRRQKRAEVRETAAREAAAKASDPKIVESSSEKVSKEAKDEATKANTEKSAEEAKVQDNCSKAVLFEPLDEIENEIGTETRKPMPNEMCATISVIPIRNINAENDYLQKAIVDKLEAKNVIIKESFIQRSHQGTFVRCDVLIEPLVGKTLEETNFEFENCRVLPFYGKVNQ